jgi:hypothetical protein
MPLEKRKTRIHIQLYKNVPSIILSSSVKGYYKPHIFLATFFNSVFIILVSPVMGIKCKTFW